MLAAMDVAGNPSSVHAEGRAAKAIVEKAREQVAAAVGCKPAEVIFTSGATEAAGILAQVHRHGAVMVDEVDGSGNIIHKWRLVRPNTATAPLELYDVLSDIGQATNLASTGTVSTSTSIPPARAATVSGSASTSAAPSRTAPWCT